jgi:hypothetical protein
MATEKFIASVQYGDWKGTSAADDADRNGIGDWLDTNGHKKPGEFLLGVSMFVGENHGVHEDPIYISFLLASLGDHDNVEAMIDSNHGPVNVRKVSVKIKLTEFFGLFKRFSVVFSPHGMLGESDYTYAE